MTAFVVTLLIIIYFSHVLAFCRTSIIWSWYRMLGIAEDLLVTEEIKNCLKLFEPNMHVEEIILFDTRTKTDKRYYVLHIKEYGDIACELIDNPSKQ